MKNTKFIFLYILISPLFLFSQTNLLYNPGFENGSGTPASVSSCDFGSYFTNDRIDDYMFDWKIGRCTDGWPATCDYKYSEPDWKGPDFGCGYGVFFNPSNSRFMYLEKLKFGTDCEPKAGTQDAIRSPLISTMDGTKNYVFKINYRGLSQFEPNQLCQPDASRTRIYFSKYSANWHANWGNTKMSFVMYPPYSWVQHHHFIPWPYLLSIVPPQFSNFNSDLKNIAIACEEGAFAIDYVELSENCEDPLLIQNHQFFYNEMPYKSSGILKAGNNVGAPTAAGDVIIHSSVTQIFKASTAIILEPGFTANNFSHFEAIIENCDVSHPFKLIPFVQNDTNGNIFIVNETDTFLLYDDRVDTLDCNPDTVKIYGLDGDTVSFTNYWWDYGNGTTSRDKVAEILYTEPGIYTVRLALTDSVGFTDTLSKIYVVPDCNKILNTPNLTAESVVVISPNPSDGHFTLQLKMDKEDDPAKIFVYNVMGQLIYQSATLNTQHHVDLSSHSKGLYSVKVQNRDRVYIERVVLQ